MLTPTEWIALATVVNSVVLVVAASYAAGQVRATREATEAQTRPWVILDLDTMSRPPVISLYIENIGRSPANDVRLSFDPPIRSTFDSEKKKIADLALLTRPIETLVPGRRIETIFDSGPPRAAADLDDIYRVTVTYSGQTAAGKKREYSEKMVLDFGVLWGMEYITPRGLADIHDRIRDMLKIMKQWSAPAGAGTGLVVKTPDDLRRQREEDQRRREEWRAERAAAQDDESE